MIRNPMHQPQQQQAPSKSTVTFDVGGKLYRVSRSLLEKHPHTILAKEGLVRTNDNKDDDKHDAHDVPIFIERNGDRFMYVLDYMRDGTVHVPDECIQQSLLLDFKYLQFTNVSPHRIIVVPTAPIQPPMAMPQLISTQTQINVMPADGMVHKLVRSNQNRRNFCTYCALFPTPDMNDNDNTDNPSDGGNHHKKNNNKLRVRTRYRCGAISCCNMPLCCPMVVGRRKTSKYKDCFALAHASEGIRLACIEKWRSMQSHTNNGKREESLYFVSNKKSSSSSTKATNKNNKKRSSSLSSPKGKKNSKKRKSKDDDDDEGNDEEGDDDDDRDPDEITTDRDESVYV